MHVSRPGRFVAPILLLLALSALSALGPAAAADRAAADPFPELEALKPNVEFWTRVFGEWTRAQAAIHDLEHPQLVYEIVDLPGNIEERYTEEQKDHLEQLRADWEDFLHDLEKKVAQAEPLEDIESQWAEYIASVVGPDGLTGAHKRIRSQRGLRERFREGLERSFRYDAAMRTIFYDAGLPEDLAYLPHVESSFQAHAVSSAGASGMWQFTRSTGKNYMTINSAIDERLDPIAATRGAAAYLRNAYNELGTWPLALTSYNHGVHGMKRAAQKFNSDFEAIFLKYDGRTFGFASKNFYAEFLAARKIAANADEYFPEGYTPAAAMDLDEIVLDRRLTPGLIAREFGVPVDDLAALNLGWSDRAVRSPLKLSVGTRVWLPAGTLDRVAASPPASGRHNGRVGEDGSYVVERGDNLSAIADAHGLSLSDLRSLNGIPRNSSLIRVGQTLNVDRGSGQDREHVVRSGDTLTRIASKYGIRLGELLSVNTLTARSIIHPGQILRIPD